MKHGEYKYCTQCPHTVNVHGDEGCRAYKCNCKETK